MIEKLMTLLVGILLALAGWTLTRTFDLSTNQAVQLDKVSKLERHVEKLQDKLEDMQDLDYYSPYHTSSLILIVV